MTTRELIKMEAAATGLSVREQLETVWQDLSLSPLFHISLSSKELFHSNLWEWLFHVEPVQALQLFGVPEGTRLEPPVKRELQHIDLTISTDKADIFVENKVKDTVRPDQLKGYHEEHKKPRPNHDEPRFIVVTLFPVSPCLLAPDCCGPWEILPYGVLTQRLGVFKCRDDYHQAIVDDYRRMLLGLTRMAEILVPADLPDLPYDFQRAHLKRLGVLDLLMKKLRMLDAYWKARLARLCTDIRPHLERQPGLEGLKIEVSPAWKEKIEDGRVLATWDIYNVQPALTVLMQLTPKLQAGIQVQDAQYRRFLCDRDLVGADKRAEAVQKAGIWFRSRDALLRYGSARDVFRYQYDKNDMVAKPISVVDLAVRLGADFEDLRTQSSDIVEVWEKAL